MLQKLNAGGREGKKRAPIIKGESKKKKITKIEKKILLTKELAHNDSTDRRINDNYCHPMTPTFFFSKIIILATLRGDKINVKARERKKKRVDTFDNECMDFNKNDKMAK